MLTRFYTQKAQESEQLRQSVMPNNYRKSTNFQSGGMQLNQAGQQNFSEIFQAAVQNQSQPNNNNPTSIIYQTTSSQRLPQQIIQGNTIIQNNQVPQTHPSVPNPSQFQEISSRCSSTSNYSYADSGAYTSSPNISPTNDQANAQVQIEPDRPIGYGAFGVVWAVTDPRDRQRVALKKMPYVFSNLVSAKRVYRELKILASVKHDNILKAQDILLPPENLHEFKEVYVVTDLLQSDLHKIIISSQPLTIDHVTIFIYQVLRGLKFLHGLGIIHRDIKPGNLLVNSNCLLKVCDFGLSREYGALITKSFKIL